MEESKSHTEKIKNNNKNTHLMASFSRMTWQQKDNNILDFNKAVTSAW